MTVSFRPMGEAPEPPPPEKILIAKRMAALADRQLEALATIEDWGIQVDAISRLREGERLLREVSVANAFPRSHEELVKVAHAARDAQEFAEISGMLPDEPIHPVAIALKDAISNQASETDLRPYQAQAELWVGAMLSCAVDFVGSPLRHGRPDYIVRSGDMQYGIEVKRPQSAVKIMRRASKASKQLRPWNPKYHGGALVMDLTDCLESGLATTLHPGAPNLEDAQEWIGRQLRRLHRFVYDDSAGRIRSDQHHVFCVVAIARLVHWDLDDLSQIYLTRFIGCLVFPKSPKTLRGIRTAWLAELIHRGMQAAGHHDLGGHEIVFENPDG